jgi:uncharacterized alpha/beta hydrolase family protein
LLPKDTKTNNDTQLLPAQYKYEERKKERKRPKNKHTHTHKERKQTNKRKKDEYPNVVLVGIKCQRSSSNKFASGLMREMGTRQTDGFG